MMMLMHIPQQGSVLWGIFLAIMYTETQGGSVLSSLMPDLAWMSLSWAEWKVKGGKSFDDLGQEQALSQETRAFHVFSQWPAST